MIGEILTGHTIGDKFLIIAVSASGVLIATRCLRTKTLQAWKKTREVSGNGNPIYERIFKRVK